MGARAGMAWCALVLAVCWGCARPAAIHPGLELLKGLQGKKVGVVLLTIPPGGISESAAATRVVTPPNDQGVMGGPWQDDAEYEPIRIAERRPLQQAVVEWGSGEFSLVQDMFVEGLKRRRVASFKVEEPVSARSLPEFKSGLGRKLYPAVDYRYLARSHGADSLVVIELKDFGPYCHYIYATNDYTEVRADASVSLVDAATNRILWKTGRGRERFRTSVEARCGSEEQIPVIMGAMDKLLYRVADGMYLDFFCP
jgi:hypothetical protein